MASYSAVLDPVRPVLSAVVLIYFKRRVRPPPCSLLFVWFPLFSSWSRKLESGRVACLMDDGRAAAVQEAERPIS